MLYLLDFSLFLLLWVCRFVSNENVISDNELFVYLTCVNQSLSSVFQKDPCHAYLSLRGSDLKFRYVFNNKN